MGILRYAMHQEYRDNSGVEQKKLINYSFSFCIIIVLIFIECTVNGR